MPDVGVAQSDDGSTPSTGGTAGSGNSAKKEKSITGPVVGAVVAAVALLALIIGFALFMRRRKRRSGSSGGGKNDDVKYFPRKCFYSNPFSYTSMLFFCQVDAVPFETRPLPVGTVISPQSNPFSNSNTSPQAVTGLPPTATPGTAESNGTSTLGPMARMQDASAIQYGLAFPHVLDQDPLRQQGGGGATAGVEEGRNGRSDRGSGAPSPPSYDEVTGGQVPTHMTYIIPT